VFPPKKPRKKKKGESNKIVPHGVTEIRETERNWIPEVRERTVKNRSEKVK